MKKNGIHTNPKKYKIYHLSILLTIPILTNSILTTITAYTIMQVVENNTFGLFENYLDLWKEKTVPELNEGRDEKKNLD